MVCVTNFDDFWIRPVLELWLIEIVLDLESVNLSEFLRVFCITHAYALAGHVVVEPETPRTILPTKSRAMEITNPIGTGFWVTAVGRSDQ